MPEAIKIIVDSELDPFNNRVNYWLKEGYQAKYETFRVVIDKEGGDWYYLIMTKYMQPKSPIPSETAQAGIEIDNIKKMVIRT